MKTLVLCACARWDGWKWTGDPRCFLGCEGSGHLEVDEPVCTCPMGIAKHSLACPEFKLEADGPSPGDRRAVSPDGAQSPSLSAVPAQQ